MSGRRGVLLLAVVGLLCVAGWPAANVGAAPPPPTLAILSPADHAVIGDGSPLVIVFAVQNFNLTEPGTVGPGPAANEGHVNVSVDGNLMAVVSHPTVVLSLDSGTLTPLLKRIEAAGLVARLRSLEDERRVHVTLTAAGRRLKSRAARIPACIVAATQCSLPEIVRLTRELRDLRDRLAA